MNPIWTIAQAKARHRGPFFTREAMAAWHSRIHDAVWAGDGETFFVTSERIERQARRYTVRVIRWDDGTIRAVGTFMGHETDSTAYAACQNLAILSRSSANPDSKAGREARRTGIWP